MAKPREVQYCSDTAKPVSENEVGPPWEMVISGGSSPSVAVWSGLVGG